MSIRRTIVLSLLAVLWSAVAHAQGTPTLGWSSLGGAGFALSSGGTYRLGGTTGQPDATVSTGGVYRVSGGYWVMANQGLPLGVEPAERIPTEFALGAPAPNPFTGATAVELALPKAGPVEVEVFGLHGERVRTLVRDTRPAGAHRLVWDGRDGAGHPVSAGVYFVRARTSERTAVQRLVRLD